MMVQKTVTTLSDIADRIDVLTQATLSNKQTLDIKEASAYTNLTSSYLYKLTSTQEIPHYKPRGKMLYFDRSELDEWLKQNRVATNQEIEQEAASHVAGVAR